ncbi:hypothetical protein Pint_30561 [Pistacia integerrima]|uniref:Uncharacterized protein n=1 Tax=Pistacia integerrima TaxID=434235 RepID=A0ACC0X3A9_9ROSI|nr:hypothetical protein Pint_30561 [Pistacia integerrima]
MEELEEDHLIKNNGYISPSSSPPTPPSPLPISVGPGNQKYSFSPSPSPSPPFSPLPSRHGTADNLPLLLETLSTPAVAQVPSTFSLDKRAPDEPSGDSNSCLKELLDWFVVRCCSCFSWSSQILDRRLVQSHSD